MYGFNEGLFDDIVDIDVPDTAAVIDIDDTVDEGPEVGVATGIADMVLRLINAENDTITDYNSARTTLAQDPTYAEFIEVIDDIEAEELKHVGQLQTLLKRLSPNASNIEAGEEEAEGQLTEDLDNMERVTKDKKINIYGEMPIVMADAVMTSEEADDAVEDELEEHNKKTEVKLNKVLGAEKQPVPKLPEMAKVTLDESLFEDYEVEKQYKHNKLIEGRKSKEFVDSHGISYSDEDRATEPEDDLFSMVEEELCPTTYKFMKHTKFPDVSWHRYSSSEVRVDPDFNIEVDVEDPDRLDFAFKVADAYNLPVKGPFKLRNGKYALTIKIEE